MSTLVKRNNISKYKKNISKTKKNINKKLLKNYKLQGGGDQGVITFTNPKETTFSKAMAHFILHKQGSLKGTGELPNNQTTLKKEKQHFNPSASYKAAQKIHQILSGYNLNKQQQNVRIPGKLPSGFWKSVTQNKFGTGSGNGSIRASKRTQRPNY